MNWKMYGLPEPVPEYKFCPGRKFRFDYAWPDLKIAVEQEGAVWIQGRHTRGAGFVRDMSKYNLAAKFGWRVFRFTPQEIKKGIAQSFLIDVFAADRESRASTPETRKSP